MVESQSRQIGLAMVVSVIAVAVLLSVSVVAATGTSLTLSPTDGQEIQQNDTATYDVVLGTADNGVGAIEYTVNVSDTSVATITDASLNRDTQFKDVSIAADGSSVTVTGTTPGWNASGTDVVVGTVTVEGAAAGSADLSLNVEYVEDVDGNAYTIDPVTGSSVTVTAGPTTDVGFSSAEKTIAEGGFTTVDIVVRNASIGVGSYNFTVETADESVVEVVNVSVPESELEFELSDTERSRDNSSITVTGVTKLANGTDVTIAEVRLKGVAISNTSVVVDFSDGFLTGINGTAYTIGNKASMLTTVTSPPDPVTDDSSKPIDADKDGKFEDVDGNGVVDARDILTLWNNRNEVADSVFFDYNDDGMVDARDVLGLWNDRR